MAKPSTEEKRKELEKEFDEYLSSRLRGQEAYEFDIKIQKIDLPRGVRRNFTESIIDDTVQSFMAHSLKDFAEALKKRFNWIHNWHQEGRSGGWLVLEPDYGILEKETGIQTLRNRLKDLRTIDKLVQQGLREVVKTMESRDYWEIPKQDWSPRDE